MHELLILVTLIQVKCPRRLFLFEEIKFVLSNHFGIVRLKTQSEKYMALKDEILKLVFLLKKVIISSEKSNHFFVIEFSS